MIVGLKALDDTVVGGGAAFCLIWTKYRREPCQAVRDREVRLGAGDDGLLKWAVTETLDDEVRALVVAVESCQFATQDAVAAHLGWDKTKVSRMKRKAIKAGRISDAEWDGCLSEAKGQDFDHGF